jgi:LysR family transcriptional activator of nhaA
VFNHPLGETGTTFCAEKKLAASLKGRFPKSLHMAPALLPSENTPFRRTLDTWFRELQIQPRIVAEFEDLALMKVMASEGRGFIAVPSLAISDAVDHYHFAIIGQTDRCRVQFHAVTAERRLTHTAVALITESARKKLDPL